MTITSCVSTYGGAIRNEGGGNLTLIDSTITGNSAVNIDNYSGNGAAIYTDGPMSIFNSTIANNNAIRGGGIFNDQKSQPPLMVNDIVAGNTDSAGEPDVCGSFNSQAFNLIGKTDGSTGFNAGDLTGTVAKPLSAKLGALASNGGPTMTLLPQAGSPVINAGDNASVPKGITTDQRGLTRIVGTAVDIGAVEVQAAATLTVTAQSHTFAKAATDVVTVTVTDAAGHSGKATFNVAVVAATQSISGTVFSDANKNGKQDAGEAGIAGVKVYIDTGKAGADLTGDPTATTTSTGAYTFKVLSSGTYRVREVLPAGYVQTAATAGYYDVVLSGGGGSGHLFADTLATSGISGRVFGDTNADGMVDNFEMGLGLWQVYIDANNDGKLESTERVVTTDVNGNWSFTGLTAGTYTVRVVQVPGTAPTKPTGSVLTPVVAAGQMLANNLFGERAIV